MFGNRIAIYLRNLPRNIIAMILTMSLLPSMSTCSDSVSTLEKKAEQGSASAMVELGVKYYQGEGVDSDIYIAAHWFQQAADKKFPDGWYWLGIMTEKGEGGIDQDNSRAIGFFDKAAAQDHLESILRLAHIYDQGELGQTSDENQALEWYRKAVALGHTEKQTDVDRLTTSITEKQRQKEESIRKAKTFESALSDEDIRKLITITPQKISTAYENHSIDPSLYYSQGSKTFEILPGKTWQSVDGSVVTFYITNHWQFIHIDSIHVTISGKTLQREDDMFIWPVTSDSKTEIITDLRPGESRQVTVYFETEVDLQSKGGVRAGLGAGLSNVFAKAGKAAGNKGFRIAMDPATIQFDLSYLQKQYVGDFDEKLNQIINAARSNFTDIYGNRTSKNSDENKCWDSTVILPHTSDNCIWYWKNYDYYEFQATIVKTESTSEGRQKTNDFIQIIEQVLGPEWKKTVIPSDDWDIDVYFENNDIALRILSQQYKTIDLYEADLKIRKRR